MGVFGAVFGCRGDAGFSGPLLEASSGVVGFNVATLSRRVREKVRPAGQRHRVCAKIFALRAENTPKLVFLGLLGELFRGPAVAGIPPGELCREGPERPRRWVSLWHLDGGPVPPLDLGRATDPRSRAQDLGLTSRRGCPKEPQVGIP